MMLMLASLGRGSIYHIDDSYSIKCYIACFHLHLKFLSVTYSADEQQPIIR